jgi:hypothetical protein
MSRRSANGKRGRPRSKREVRGDPFIVAADVIRSPDFYTDVLGGKVVPDGEPTIVKLPIAG